MMNIKTEERISYQYGNFKSSMYFLSESLFEGKYRVAYKILYKMDVLEYSDYLVSNALKKFGCTEIYSDEKCILFFEDLANPVRDKKALMFSRIKKIAKRCNLIWLDIQSDLNEYDPADDIDWDVVVHERAMGRYVSLDV